jgi:hypothetical protein
MRGDRRQVAVSATRTVVRVAMGQSKCSTILDSNNDDKLMSDGRRRITQSVKFDAEDKGILQRKSVWIKSWLISEK